jgi:hypothetical protein
MGLTKVKFGAEINHTDVNQGVFFAPRSFFYLYYLFHQEMYFLLRIHFYGWRQFQFLIWFLLIMRNTDAAIICK